MARALQEQVYAGLQYTVHHQCMHMQSHASLALSAHHTQSGYTSNHRAHTEEWNMSTCVLPAFTQRLCHMQ
jgi:hypothetical protein